MSRIQLLDSQVANQISAGEVVERPASVMKECIENSLDAQATQITLDVMQGGHELIRVRDNGKGIHADDLPLALSRHATSKVVHFKDLEAIYSLGFRGEALASIAAVSRLTLTSAIEGQSCAYRVVSEAGQETCEPASHPTGTTVEVRDLFYNTPARRKFLRAPRTEFLHLQTVVHRLALSRFDVGFTLNHNQRPVFQSPVAIDVTLQERRIAQVMGDAFLKEALCLEYEGAGLTLTGYIALPVFSRAQPDMQYVYINGRFVRDKLIAHAVKQAYHDVLFHGRYPAYVLFLTMNPALVDVNVHPTKHEVRFRDSRLVHDALVRAVTDVLTAVRPHAEQNTMTVQIPEASGESPVAELAHAGVSLSAPPVSQAIHPMSNARAVIPEEVSPVLLKPMPVEQSVMALETRESTDHAVSNELTHDQASPTVEPAPVLGVALTQLHDIFILAQNEQGLVIVDMHAAHERILFEKMKRDFEQQSMPTQTLLVPIAVEVTPHEMLAWETHQSVFESVGLQVSAMGITTLSLRGVPVYLKDMEGHDLIHQILAELMSHDNSRRSHEVWSTILGNMACHQAIKAHHTLSREAMNALLRQMEQTPNSGYCNHGRPTWVQYSMKELDKLFLRGQ